jgi:short subunit dehydrogenase-like uncharacterized protein
MSELDVVLFGATGYTGRMVAEDLAATAPQDLRIGLAGRSEAKLTALRDRLGRDWPVVVVDAADAAQLAGRARVVATTVGPYARYGWPLAEACAHSGTDYLDLTGEVLFHRRLIDELDKVAQDSGARLVPSCGFDSVPSDLLVHTLAEQVRAEGEGTLTDVTVVAAVKGGVSGGTVDSLRGQLDAAAADRSAAALIADGYSLSPDRAAEAPGPAPADLAPVGRVDGAWTAPFVMASYNSRIVRRSNALLDWGYGHGMRYEERMHVGQGVLAPVKAVGTAVALRATGPALRFPPTRALLDRVLPAPGDGPGADALAAGWYRMEATARTTTGASYTGVIAAQQEPYAATAVMMAQSALALALDDLPSRAGALTPATALGSALAERLRRHGTQLSARRAG